MAEFRESVLHVTMVTNPHCRNMHELYSMLPRTKTNKPTECEVENSASNFAAENLFV